jgi:hypothetical protein
VDWYVALHPLLDGVRRHNLSGTQDVQLLDHNVVGAYGVSMNGRCIEETSNSSHHHPDLSFVALRNSMRGLKVDIYGKDFVAKDDSLSKKRENRKH